MRCRAEIALTDGRLMGVAREINSTSEEESELRRTLSDLEQQLRDVNATVAHKQRVLDDFLTSGFAGSRRPLEDEALQNIRYVCVCVCV